MTADPTSSRRLPAAIANGDTGAQPALKVGGLAPLSTEDFPGALACVVFVSGCPWRCLYCQSPRLQSRARETRLHWGEVAGFLRRHVGALDAVVFSGGEPLVDGALPAAMREARSLGFRVGLHTAGAYPRRLAACLPLVDWVGMDVKADLASYDQVTRRAGSAQRAWRSIRLLLEAGTQCEFRTTWHPAVVSDAALMALTAQLSELGAQRYALQVFRPHGSTSSRLRATRSAVPAALLQKVAARFPDFVLRRA